MKTLFLTAFFLLIGLQSAVFSQIKRNESFGIPANIKNAKYDMDVDKYTPLFIEVRADGKIYKRERLNDSLDADGQRKKNFEYSALNDTNFIAEMNKYFSDRPKAPDKNWVYLSADIDVKFGKLAEIFRSLAKSEVQPTGVQFVVNPLAEISRDKQTESGGYVLTLNLPQKEISQAKTTVEDESPAPPPVRLPPGYKEKPKTPEQVAAEEKARNSAKEKAEARKKIKVEKLIVELSEAGKTKFNAKPQTAAELSANLKKIFDERTYYEIFRPFTNEIDNTVYLKVSPNVKYGEAIKLIDEIYGGGANRIYLEDKSIIPL